MTRKYFGTDGVRGRVGEAPITPDFVLKLGYAAGKVLAMHDPHPRVLIGKDTRISGYMLESALESGLSAAGVDTLLSGPMPTPGVAFLTRAMRLSAGIMVSASHNPYEDNGIKFFSGEGTKLPDAVEHEIEDLLDQPLVCNASDKLGKAQRVHDSEGRYIEFCKGTFPKRVALRGVKMVVDCANGAGYRVAPRVFEELGADVTTIGAQPNGLNINDKVGATHPVALADAVVRNSAHVGVALDGDGDRLIMVDGNGHLYDGDQLLYAIVKHRLKTGTLRGGAVGTLMTNLALERRLSELKVPFARAKVGDRYVLEVLQEHGWEVGGENSGHLLCLDQHSTGDSIISALQVLAALVDEQQSLAYYTRELTLYPQVMKNVRMMKRIDLAADAPLQQSIKATERELGARGRILIRPSGTEPVVRVMVEAQDKTEAESAVDKLVGAVKSAAERAGALA